MSKRSMIFNSLKNHNLHQILRCHDSLNKNQVKSYVKKETNNFIGLNKKSNITNKRNDYG